MERLKSQGLEASQQHIDSDTQILKPMEKSDAAGHLVLAFGSVAIFEDPSLPARLRDAYPGAVIAGCTTSGEITAAGVHDDTLVCSSLEFQKTTIRAHRVEVESMAESEQAGVALAEALGSDDLSYLFLLSSGLSVNGSALVRGIRRALPPGVLFSGGLAGDASRFEKTLVLDGEHVGEKSVVGIGFYGDALRVGCASVGGWAPFGPYRTVTRSNDNVLYEIDGQRALDVYSAYLGDEARDLPASGLLFPLAIASENGKTGLIRTLLSIDKDAGSMTFAGDILEGTTVQLMHADFDQLVKGAETASEECMKKGFSDVGFAILISCVGRKLLLGNNTDLEVDAVVETFGEDTIATGFYSYGEIGPYEGSGCCELHNQTMTVTVLFEG